MMHTVEDQMHRKVSLPQQPMRIVSLVPSQTELLYDLGLDDRVVGITKFCIHPAAWKKTKTIVGGTKNVRHEAIDLLQPDLIIGNKEENRKEDIEALALKYPVWMSDIYTLTDALEMITQLAQLTHTEERGTALTQSIQHAFHQLPQEKKGTAAYLIWKKPYMLAGKNTFIDAMLDCCGLTNVCVDDRYVEKSMEEIAAFPPDYLLLSSEPYPFTEKDCAEWRNLLPNTCVQLVDGEMFSWYGSRLQHAPSYFVGIL